MFQFMSQHRLKLAAVKVLDHPGREQQSRSEQPEGEGERSMVGTKEETRSGCAKPLRQVISQRLKFRTSRHTETSHDSCHERESYHPQAKCAKRKQPHRE